MNVASSLRPRLDPLDLTLVLADQDADADDLLDLVVIPADVATVLARMIPETPERSVSGASATG
jgi:hypothetical protein